MEGAASGRGIGRTPGGGAKSGKGMDCVKKIISWAPFFFLVWCIVNSVGCFALAIRFFDLDRITPACLFNAGVDVLGSWVCAALYYGTIRQQGEENGSYMALIYFTSMSFYINECMWFLSGVPAYRMAYLGLNVVSHLFDFALVFFFFQYVRKSLELKGKLADWMDRASRIFVIPCILLALVNLLYPVCFSVDADGIFHQEGLYRLIDLYLVFVAPPTVYLIIRSQALRREKIVACSFVIIPIAHYLATGGASGYATQYGSVLMSLTMIACILFSSRSRKLTATQTELNVASRMQEAMLPSTFPPFPDRTEFDPFASMDPAREVGGDFYDFFMIDDDHLCTVIADVSGKGVPAALFMMMSRIVLKSCAMLVKSPAEILTKANEGICENNAAEMFVTVWLGILEISTGKLTAANAGHEYPMLRKREGERFEIFKDRHGFVIGGLEGSGYREYEIRMEPGTCLFVYTDGATDASNAQGEMFGMDRLKDAVNMDTAATPREICANVTLAVDRFVRETPQFDDLTMLCLEYRGTGRNDGPAAEAPDTEKAGTPEQVKNLP